MDIDTIRRLRKKAGLTQGDMAARIGLRLRRYNGIEEGAAPLGAIHLNAIGIVFLRLAVERQDPELIPANLLERVGGLRELTSS